MTGRPRLDELFSLACWEPGEEAEAAAIIDTLEAEVRELRRILYAAIDPESGARSAQDVRDLVQGELNTVAGSNPAPVRGSSGPASSTGTAEHGLAGERGDGCCVRSRPAISSPIATTREVTAPGSLPPRRGPRPQSTEKQGPGALTSFGADDWATVEAALVRGRGREVEEWTPEEYEEIKADWAPAFASWERLREADQAKTEALREIASVSDARADDPLYTRDVARAALAAAAAAPKETP